MLDRKALSNLGCHVYGFGSIMLGITCIVWDTFATNWQPVPPSIPYRSTLTYILAACLVLGGAAIQWRRTVRGGVLLLAIPNLIYTWLWGRRVVGFPGIFGTWGGFAEALVLLLAAGIIYASAVERDTTWAVKFGHACRILFGLCAIAFGLEHFTALPQTVSMVPEWIPPNQQFWAIATGVAHLLAGVAIASGIMALLASRLLTLMLFTFSVFVWFPSFFSDPGAFGTWAGNGINLAFVGSAWIVADWIAVHGSGMSSWRGRTPTMR